MKKSVLYCIAFLSAALFLRPALAQRDDDMIREYPDGELGIELEGGYEIMPDGELLLSPEYREDYRDSRYGPMTQEGFPVFPGFSFIKPEKKPAEKKEEKILIFHEATTTAPESVLWGVYYPGEDDQGSGR